MTDQLALDAGLPGHRLFAPERLQAGPRLALDRELVPEVGLHPAVACWFRRRFGDPTPAQAQGWPPVAAGRNTLIAAPTGSGKTLTGFLMAINRLYLESARGQLEAEMRVVYVSPLKALASDIAENLERPLAEIAAVALELGHRPPELTVGLRTGDTPQSQRQAMIRRPPTFMITTPESLYLLVTAAKPRATLASVDTIIVDEIHALARDKRGAHLALTLERLHHVCGQTPCRIGLSATQRPIETVARLLVGTRNTETGQPDCAVVDVGQKRHVDVALELPDMELEAVASDAQMAWILDRIAELVAEHQTTLVFVNTRRLAERLAHELAERLGDDEVAAHHGSLSKERRQRVERRLRAGQLRALVATASLELGIDVGPVELVCQLGSPRSIATFMQRIGRANHHRHGTPKGRLFPQTRDDLIECAGLLSAVRSGELDAVLPPVAPLDILAQQIVAETGAAEWTSDALYQLMTTASPFASLDRTTFDDVVALVSEGIMTGRGRRAAWVHADTEHDELRGRRGARYVALTSGGAIPDIYDMRVVLEPDETFIGTVTEEWASESSSGDIFLLGSHSWQIRRVTSGEVRVVDAGDAPPTIPVWAGEAPARTAELSEQVSAIRHLVDQHLQRADPGGAKSALKARCGIDEIAASTIVTYLAAAKAVLGTLPTSTTLVMERFFDDADGMQLVIHSPLGARVNRAMGYALRKKFCVGFNFELQAAASDDAVVISLGPHHSFPLNGVVRFLRPATIHDTLSQAILDQPAFQSRWRWNLNRALVVLRFRNGKRNPPPIQRMESDDLLAALFPDAAACQENVSGPATIPDHPLVAQTVHDTLTESLDVDGLIQLWTALESGTVEMRVVDSPEPSLLAHEILTARPYAFLDDDTEVIDRRTRAVPLRRGLPTDIESLATPDTVALPDDLVEQARRDAAPDPRNPDELHDLLCDLVVMRPRPEWHQFFEQLQARGRADEIIDVDGLKRWTATSMAERVAVLQTGEARDQLFPELVASEAVRGHLQLLSPTTAAELAEELGLSSTLIAVALASLESEGSVLQGRFTTAARTDDQHAVQWCARRVLVRLHGQARSRRRRAVESASPEEFQRFLARWQHVVPGSQLRGPSGVRQAIAQLQGWAAPVAAWEPDLLAKRVENYDPAWLDQLCHAGELQWFRLRPPSATPASRTSTTKATPVSVLHRADRSWLLAAYRSPEPIQPTPGGVDEVAAILARRGPRFVLEIAEEANRLPSDVEMILWEGVAQGLFTADGFGAIRALAKRRAEHSAGQRRVSRLRRAGLTSGLDAGRWSLVLEHQPDEASDERESDEHQLVEDQPDEHELAEAVADQLLQRWGVVFYDLVVLEKLHLKWRALQWALRRLEDRGQVVGGRFVRGFAGEQFALPQAVDQLRDLSTGRTVEGRTPDAHTTVCGADPLNLTAVILPGPRIPARRTETVVLRF